MRSRGEAGFTMLELLITLAVATIGMTGAIALHLAIVKSNANAAASGDALTVAERTVEDARSLTLDQMFVEYEDSDAALPIDYSFGGATEQGRTATFVRRILVEQVQGDLIRIHVEVSWGENGGDVTDPAARHTVALELLRTRQETL